MRTKKNAVPGMQIQSFRKVYMIFQRKFKWDKKLGKMIHVGCDCSKAEMCSKCKCTMPASIETVIDGIKARYNLKKGSVAVHSPDKVLRNRSGTPSGEMQKGEIWHGSFTEFQSSYSPSFVHLCALGWAAANEDK